MKGIVKKYDFFIAQASLMPSVATTFGRSLGPTGKMPSPQLGIVMNADDKTIKELKGKIDSSIKIKVKEACKLIHYFALKGHLNTSPSVCQGQS